MAFLLAAVLPRASQASPGTSYSDCTNGSGNVCGSVGGAYLECDLSRAFGGDAAEVWAVYDTTFCGTANEYCVWGAEVDAGGGVFCCELDATTETYLVILGTDDADGDIINLYYDTYDLDNHDTDDIDVFEGRVFARDGDDQINGSRIVSLDYRDKLYGEDDEDTIHGQEGDDEISGGDDDDTLFGDDGNDTINGDHGVDTIEGNDDSDTIHGGSFQDLISGGAGDDFLYGDGDPDLLCGDGGDDWISGDAGDVDLIWGGLGYDTGGGGLGGDDLCDVDDDWTIPGCDGDLLTGRPACPGP